MIKEGLQNKTRMSYSCERLVFQDFYLYPFESVTNLQTSRLKLTHWPWLVSSRAAFATKKGRVAGRGSWEVCGGGRGLSIPRRSDGGSYQAQLLPRGELRLPRHLLHLRGREVGEEDENVQKWNIFLEWRFCLLHAFIDIKWKPLGFPFNLQFIYIIKISLEYRELLENLLISYVEARQIQILILVQLKWREK